MNATTRTLVFVVVFLIFGFGLTLALPAQEIPGGIVYSDGQNAVYYDYQTGQTTNLTADLAGPPIRRVAASEDGLWLVWLQDARFYLRQLPDAAPQPATVEKSVTDKVIDSHRSIGHIIYVPMPPIQKKIKKLTLSPEGVWINCEFTEIGNEWILVEPGKPGKLSQVYNTKTGQTSLEPHNTAYPKYKYSRNTGEFNACVVQHATSGRTFFTYGFGRYGNSACYPPQFPIRTMGYLPREVDYDEKRIATIGQTVESYLTSTTTPDIAPSLTLTVKDAIERFSIRRDAHLLAWQKASSFQPTNQFFALIYKTKKGWGPIEIRSAINSFRPGGPGYANQIKKEMKTDVYEVPVLLSDCVSLAWKPDGSLTYLAGGNVFSLDSRQIIQGIEKSGIARNPNPSHYEVIPTNNVFVIKPELVTRGIDGDRLHWVTNDTFLFRGKEGSLRNIYSWHQGKIERLCLAPEEFSYCDRPPAGFKQGNAVIASGKTKTGPGIAPTWNPQAIPFMNPDILVGTIKTMWGSRTRTSIWLRVKKIENQEDLEFAFPTETNLDDIKNPTRYDYRKPTNLPQGSGDNSLPISLNQVIILKQGNRYAAIKPLEVEYYQSPDEIRGNMKELCRADWKTYSALAVKELTYEWKYWPQSVKIDSNAKNGDELTDKSLKPLMGKAETTNNQIAIEAAEDIKIVWEKTVWGVNLNTNRNISGIGFRSELLQFGTWAEWTSLPDGEVLLESVVDPSKYKYYPFSTNSKSSAQGIIQFKAANIFKIGSRYLAIKPLELKKQGTSEVLVYEWKYWPAASSASAAKTNGLTKK